MTNGPLPIARQIRIVVENNACLDRTTVSQVFYLHAIAFLVAIILPNAMGAKLSRVDADDLRPIARSKVPATARNKYAKPATDFPAVALTTVVDSDIRTPMEGG
jgi:hypothetical protein